MTFNLPHKTKTIWQIRFVFVISFLCFFILLFGHNHYWIVLISAIIAIVGLLLTFIYLPVYFKSYKITVDEGFISVSKGVIFRSINIMPYPRLIFAQSITTPLSSLFKMKIILLKAARGWLFIPEIEDLSAEFLLEQMRIRKNGKF